MIALAQLPLLPSIILGSVLGLLAGSFLAALVTRWPKGKSVMRGRSACDACGRRLRATEIVPIVSMAIQRGRCRGCHAPIDGLHWKMEMGGGLIGLASACLWPMPHALGGMIFGWMLLALALLDARHFWLPDALTLPLLFLALTIGPLTTGISFADAAIGAATGYGSLLAVASVYRRMRGREGLGLGDAKLLGALGAWFGWQALPMILLIASVSALVWVAGVSMLTRRKLDSAHKLPFGLFLCLAAVPLTALRTLWL